MAKDKDHWRRKAASARNREAAARLNAVQRDVANREAFFNRVGPHILDMWANKVCAVAKEMELTPGEAMLETLRALRSLFSSYDDDLWVELVGHILADGRYEPARAPEPMSLQ